MRLLLPALLLAGCPAPDRNDPEDGADADADTDADTDTDAGPDCSVDTGCVAKAWWTGGFAADEAGGFVSGTFGWTWYGRLESTPVCTAGGSFTYVGAAPEGCPGCTWAWDLSALSGTTVDGPFCGTGDLDVSDGSLDGAVDYAWGFAPAYVYDYAGTPLYFEDTVMMYAEGYAWFAFAFNLPAYGFYQVEGDATSLTFARGVKDAGGGYVYYDYVR